jgi:hypothetical protein
MILTVLLKSKCEKAITMSGKPILTGSTPEWNTKGQRTTEGSTIRRGSTIFLINVSLATVGHLY